MFPKKVSTSYWNHQDNKSSRERYRTLVNDGTDNIQPAIGSVRNTFSRQSPEEARTTRFSTYPNEQNDRMKAPVKKAISGGHLRNVWHNKVRPKKRCGCLCGWHG